MIGDAIALDDLFPTTGTSSYSVCAVHATALTSKGVVSYQTGKLRREVLVVGRPNAELFQTQGLRGSVYATFNDRTFEIPITAPIAD